MKTYTVYMHTTPNGKRYIGITQQDVAIRWKSNGLGYKSQLFWRAIQKYGWDNIKHEILYIGLTKEEAKSKEIELIAKYQSDNPNYGYNQTKGGDFAREGFTTSDKQKQIASKNWKGSNNPNARPVICLEKLKVYATASEARRETNASKIMDCCQRKSKHRTSGNYHWAYYDDSKPLSYYLFLLEEYLREESKPHVISENCKRVNSERCSIPVICIETNVIYKSLREASSANGISPSAICHACKGKVKTVKGLHWKYV